MGGRSDRAVSLLSRHNGKCRGLYGRGRPEDEDAIGRGYRLNVTDLDVGEFAGRIVWPASMMVVPPDLQMSSVKPYQVPVFDPS